MAHSETYGPILTKLLAYEDDVVAEGGWHVDGTIDNRPWGGEWYEVGVAPGYLARLAHVGIVSIVMKSNHHTVCRLTDAEAVRKAIRDEIGQRSAAAEPQPDIAPWLPDLFAPIVGYDDVKELFRMALLAERPVHILLDAPPATVVLSGEVGELPRGHPNLFAEAPQDADSLLRRGDRP